MRATLILILGGCVSAHVLIAAAASRVPYTRTLRVKQCVSREPHDINRVTVTDRSTAQLCRAAMHEERALHSKASIKKVLAVICPVLIFVQLCKYFLSRTL